MKNVLAEFQPDVVLVILQVRLHLLLFINKSKWDMWKLDLEQVIFIVLGQKKQIDRLLEYCQTITLLPQNNLLKENKDLKDIIVTGNTVIDALFLALRKIKRSKYKKTNIRFKL